MKKTNMNKNDILEAKVTKLLQHFAKDEHSKTVIVPHLAKVSLEMNHLYEDLGFKNRIEMGRYMKEYFPKLCEIKPTDTLWKKYIYDLINETAPACAECNDQETCFACRI
ncbi:MAG: nitrogen fixation protein NifQ [Sulfurimonas sp.]|jgi:nitrogen fixation protein NifQ